MELAHDSCPRTLSLAMTNYFYTCCAVLVIWFLSHGSSPQLVTYEFQRSETICARVALAMTFQTYKIQFLSKKKTPFKGAFLLNFLILN